jgi:outer membrane protein
MKREGSDMTDKPKHYIKKLHVIGTLCLFSTMPSSASAADLLPAVAPQPIPVLQEIPLGFFVKLGFIYAINTTTSHLYSQQVPVPGASQYKIPGVRAILGDVATLGFEGGYLVTPNVSIDLAGGIPMYAKVKTTGAFPPGSLPVASGTKLSTVMPSIIPLTVLYHFEQFGRFQPYIGGGAAAVFSFTQKNGFSTDVRVDPTVGLALQAGADIMLDSHWGWSIDVKKVFAYGETHTKGINLSFIGAAGSLPLQGTLKTRYQPWLLATGVVYRF